MRDDMLSGRDRRGPEGLRERGIGRVGGIGLSVVGNERAS